jgi:hypothetical protein
MVNPPSKFLAARVSMRLTLISLMIKSVILFIAVALVFIFIKNDLHLCVEEVADLLHDRDSIAALYRVLTELDEVIKQLIDIGSC